MVVRNRLCGAGLIKVDVYYLIEKQNRPKPPPSSLSLSLSLSLIWSVVGRAFC